MQSEEYHLKPGTKLAGRYAIRSVIGEGGFGITYEAVNENIDMRVAIKEFYCKDFVKRDIGESNQIYITYADYKKDFDSAKERFLKEAKLLSEFNQETGIVHILDYFEENETAYIVMNYIQGQTLESYLKQCGSVSWEQLYKMMKPLIQTLGKIHSKGIVHRDISSNNIMVQEDGFMCLLDFGAAKEYIKNDGATTMVFSKRGYTPIEQYNKSDIGAWTDVYALMAVCYECMTGKRPPDALQRVQWDEYESLKKNGISAPAQLERIFRKGLAVNWKERYQDTASLVSDIDTLMSDHRQKKKTAVKRISLTASILALAVLLFGGLYCLFNKEKIMFLGRETETFYLFGDSVISSKEYRNAVAELEKRVKILAGDNPYIFEEKDNVIKCVVPLECFDNYIPGQIIEQLVSNSAEFYISGGLLDSYTMDAETIKIVNRDDTDGKIEFCLTDKVSEEFREHLENMEQPKAVFSGKMDGAYGSIEFPLERIESVTYRISTDTWGFNKIIEELLIHSMKSAEETAVFDCKAQVQAEWEDAKGSDKGKNQCARNKLEKAQVIQVYSSSLFWENVSEGERLDAENILKKRLDCMAVPYAFGIEKNSSDNFVVCVEQKNYSSDLFRLLNASSGDIRICDSWGRSLIDDLGRCSFGLEKTEADGYTLAIESSNEDSAMRERISEMLADGRDTYYLQCGGIRLFKGRLLDDIDKSFEKGRFVFSESMFNSKTISMEDEKIIMLLQNIVENDAADYYKCIMYHYCDSSSAIAVEPSVECNVMALDREWEERIIEQLQTSVNGVQASYYYDSYLQERLQVEISRETYAETINDVTMAADLLKKIFEVCDIKNGTPFYDIVIGVPDGEKQRQWAANIVLTRQSGQDAKAPYNISFFGRSAKESIWLEAVCDAMKKDDEYGGYEINFSNLSEKGL